MTRPKTYFKAQPQTRMVGGLLLCSNISIPTREPTGMSAAVKAMRVGESFYWLGSRSAVRKAAKRHGVKITQRKNGKGLRFWRVK